MECTIQNSYLKSSSIIKIYLTLLFFIWFAIVLHVLLNYTTNLLHFYDENFLQVMLEIVNQICYTTLRREMKSGLGLV